MSLLRLITFVFLGSLPLWSGCTAMNHVRTAASNSVRALRPTTDDYADPTEQSSDPWIQQAGAEARGQRPLEKSTEPAWFMNLVRSPKAQEIENNLGFE